MEPIENFPKNQSSLSITFNEKQNSTRDTIMQNIINNTKINHKSLISTSKNKNNNNNHEKSKIKILPNHEKFMMGNHLPFIVIFQTIEIQRLSDQVETQRVKIKQLQKLIFNSQNFEIQIKELLAKCNTYELQIQQYKQQLNKLNKICETLFEQNQCNKIKVRNIDGNNPMMKSKLEDEIKKNKYLEEQLERWIQKYNISEQSKESQIQTIKQMIENQRRSMIDREIKDIQVKYQSEISKLNVEIRRLNDALLNKQKDIEDLRIKYLNSQQSIKQFKKYGLKLNQYEQKINLMNQQHLRLSHIIDNNANQLDLARKRQFNLAKQLNNQKQMAYDKSHLKMLLKEKQQQLTNCKQKMSQFEQQIMRGHQLIHINSQLQSKLQCMYLQNDKLVKLLKERLLQIEKWKNVALELERENKKKRQIQDMLIKQQAQYKVLQAEQERVENICKTKTKQIQQLKNKFIISQNQLAKLNIEQRDRKIFEDKQKAQIERILELENHIEKLQNQSQITNQLNKKLRATQLALETYKKQKEILENKINQLENQLNNIKRNEISLGKQYGKLKENQITIIQYKDKHSIMNDQIDRLNQLLKLKNNEIVKLEDEKINSIAFASQCKRLQNQLQEKQRLCAKVKLQLQTNQQKIKQYEENMDDIDQKNKEIFNQLKQQIGLLENQVKERSRQCEQLKIKQAKLQNQTAQITQLQKQCNRQKNKLTVYFRDLQDLRAQNKQYQSILSEQKRKLQELERKALSTSQIGNGSKKQMYASTKSITTNCTTDSQHLMTKINKLQNTVKELQMKYFELLKQASGSNHNISVFSINGSLKD